MGGGSSRRGIRSGVRIAVIGVALLATALPGWSCGVTERASSKPPPLSVSGVYPGFDPQRHLYVSHCGRGGPAVEVERGGDGVAANAPGSGRDRRFSAAPGHDFSIAPSGSGGGAARPYRVRCLPARFPSWRFERMEPSGRGLFVVAVDPKDDGPWVIVFDQDGAPRWWFRPQTRVLWAQMLSDGRFSWARSFGDGYGIDPRMAHEIHAPSGKLIRLLRTRGSITDGHELRELPNGHLLLDTYAPAPGVELANVAAWKKRRPPQRGAVVFAEVQEIDRAGRVVWRWNSRGHIRLGETGRWWRSVLVNSKHSRYGPALDPVHINSIEPDGRQLVISTRHTDAVYGIDRRSGRIRWKLGGTETPRSLRVVGDPARRLFGGPHDARIGSDGRLTIMDNGKGRPRMPRVAFYRLDLRRRTATYLGQLNDPLVPSSHCCGSARQTEDGGWLVSWGDNPLVSGFDRHGRLAFRLHLPASSYRAVPVPPGATSVAALDRGMEAMEDIGFGAHSGE